MNQQQLVLAGVLLEEHENRNHVRLIRRNLRDTTNPFEIPDNYFKNLFRLDKASVLNLIDRIDPFLPQLRRDTIPVHLKLLATLHFLATGSFQNSVGGNNFLSVSQSSMSRIINEICTIISDHFLPQWVKFCATREEKNSIKRGFYEKWGARGVLGCIDGTHVEILAPPITDENHPSSFVYINRKGKHSINVMLISDSNAKIIACNARYPGSVHDSAIWQLSNIKRHLSENYENGDKHSHLIGDSGYPLEPWLYTPINNPPEGSPGSRFNEELCRVRNVIERTNGILKGRFRCLSRHRVLMYHPARAAKIIYTCCVLHNIALEARIPPIDEDIEDYEEVNENIQDIEQQNDRNIFHLGRLARDDYIRTNIM